MKILNRRSWSTTAAIIAVTVMAVSFAAADNAAAVTTGNGNDTYTWSLSPTVTEKASPSAQSNGTLAAAQVWANCGLFDDNTKIVRTFTRYRADTGGNYLPGGPSNLACGSEAWGYRHIVKNHLSQWESDASIAQENWRELADLSIASALSDPDRTGYRRANDTFCFSRLIYLINNRTGKVVDQRKPIVIVGHVTKNIITAYPNNTGC